MQSEELMHLDKHGSAAQWRPPPINSKRQISEEDDPHLAGASLYIPKGFESTTSLPDKNSFPIG
jgi:hypothetical protein